MLRAWRIKQLLFRSKSVSITVVLHMIPQK